MTASNTEAKAARKGQSLVSVLHHTTKLHTTKLHTTKLFGAESCLLFYGLHVDTFWLTVPVPQWQPGILITRG